MPTISRRFARHVTFAGAVALGLSVTLASPAAAADPVGLGTASSFAILAGAGITNTGATTVIGDIGSYDTTTQTGMGSVVQTGTNHLGDAVTQQAKVDLVTAYNDAAGRLPVTDIAVELGGQLLPPGVYTNAATGTFGITNTLTLDFQNDPAAQFVFLTASTLITEVNSTVAMINGGDPCRVVWKVGSSATFKTGSDFVGDVLALVSISAQSGAEFLGRLLARDGAVTLIENRVDRGSCPVIPAGTTTTTTSSTTTTTTAPSGGNGGGSPSPTTTSTTTTPTTTTAAPTTTAVPSAVPTTVAFGPPTTVAASSAPGDPEPALGLTPTTVPSGAAITGIEDDDPDDDFEGPVTGDLPRTGAATGPLFALGVALIGVGSTLVRYERRC